ncbi:MAG: methyltransferase domain-containing protein [Planctomycetes bacterium]|nr:methyltransferase domain-containing protein [Planctomycetota bacterium]
MNPTDVETRIWEEAAPHWTRNAQRIAQFTAPATEGLLRRLRPAPGQRLLDIAAGTGDPAVRLAQLVGPAGHVLAADGSPGMLAALDERVRASGLSNLTTRVAAAEYLELPAATFDGACSRFGVMFFGDPARALANIRTAVRPGGCLVLVAWGARERNPFFTLATGVLDQLGTPEVATPGQRTVFEFEQPGRLAGIVAGAGWTDTREEREHVNIDLPDTTPAGLLDLLVEISRRVSDRVSALPPELRELARRRLAECAAPLAVDGSIRFPAEILFVTARAPRA